MNTIKDKVEFLQKVADLAEALLLFDFEVDALSLTGTYPGVVVADPKRASKQWGVATLEQSGVYRWQMASGLWVSAVDAQARWLDLDDEGEDEA